MLGAALWETSLQPHLRRKGGVLLLTGTVRVRHCKAIPWGLFTRQRFLYSRCFAARRFAARGWPQRLAGALASPFVAPLMLARQARLALGKPPLRGRFIGALPWLLWFYAVAAAGEVVGSLLGPGDALARIE